MNRGGTQSEHDRPNRATRLRLLELSTPLGTLQFNGELSCVLTPADGRHDVAALIARAVIGPRPPDIAGTIDIAGRLVELQSLPAPLLPPRAPSLINDKMLDDLWQQGCARQSANVHAAHAARRLERHRTDAALERARARVIAAPVVAPAPLATTPLPQSTPFTVDEITPRLQGLVDRYDSLRAVPSGEAIALVAAFDELAARPAPPIPQPAPVDVDIDELRQRVANARVAVADAAGGVRADARAHIQEHHRAVVEAERALFDATRKSRAAALAHYQAALAAERSALAEAGVDSYASFLVAVAAGSAPVDLEARLRAELELAHPQAELEHGTARLSAPPDTRADDELALRARAAQLLGHFPGDDPSAELRALKVEHPDAAPLRAEIGLVLASIGVHDGDVVTAARRTIAERQAAPHPAPVVAVPPQAPAAPVLAPRVDDEVDALERERANHDVALADLESQMESLATLRAGSLAQLDGTALTIVAGELLEQYRNAQLFAGRLPLVLDGAFDKLSASAVAAIARFFASVDDVQLIVVTDRRPVADAFAAAGGRTQVWPSSTHVMAADDEPQLRRRLA